MTVAGVRADCVDMFPRAALLQQGQRAWRLHAVFHRRTPSIGQHQHLRCASAASSSSDLLSWVVERGGQVAPAVAVEHCGGEVGGGYGLKAKRDISSGSKLIHLPSTAHLTYDDSSDPNLLTIINKVPQELWGAKLALQVLSHRVAAADSLFHTYITNLPIGVPGIPVFFSGDELAALQYPPVSEQVKKRCRWMLEFTSSSLNAKPHESSHPFSGVTLDANVMGWALAVVTSRAFRTRGPSQPAAMLPLIDMANHSFAPNCEIRPAGGGAVAMMALRDIPKGEDLMLSYGKLSNDFLLMDYGFVVPNNPHDDIKLKFDVSLLEMGAAVSGMAVELSPAPWQIDILRQSGLMGDKANTEVLVARRPTVDPRLLAAVRVLLCNDMAELRGRGPDSLGEWDSELSVRNEVSTLRTLVGVCAVVLSHFGSTLEQDVKLLTSDDGLSANMKLAISFRVEKKKVLVEAMQEMGNRLKSISEWSMSPSPPSAHTRGGSNGGPSNATKAKTKGKAKKATSKGFG